MKILLLSSTNNIRNGYGNITHELCSYFKDKIDFKLLLPKNEPRYEYTDYETEYVLPEYIFNFKTPKVIDYFTFRYPAKEYNLIHSLFEFPYSIVATRLAKKHHKPLIIGTQGTYAIQPLFFWPEKYFVRWTYNAADVITAPSVFTKEHILQFSKTTTPIEVIHNGVNFERFKNPVEASEIKSLYPGKKILITVGGLKSRKGQALSLRALGRLKKKRDDFQYLLIGSGKYRSRLEDITREEGLENNVIFVGEISGNELVKYFWACDIYLHTPTLVNWNFEGFGIVYLEASACKKPIVATDAGGIKDAVIHNKTGLVVPENDTDSVVGALEALLDNPALASRLGEGGYEYAHSHDWPCIGEKFTNLYKGLIER